MTAFSPPSKLALKQLMGGNLLVIAAAAFLTSQGLAANQSQSSASGLTEIFSDLMRSETFQKVVTVGLYPHHTILLLLQLLLLIIIMIIII